MFHVFRPACDAPFHALDYSSVEALCTHNVRTKLSLDQRKKLERFIGIAEIVLHASLSLIRQSKGRVSSWVLLGSPWAFCMLAHFLRSFPWFLWCGGRINGLGGLRKFAFELIHENLNGILDDDG